MNKIDGYSVYQSNFYKNTMQSRKAAENTEVQDTQKTEQIGQVKLSDRAKELLEELKRTYSNMDFMVANYENEEEAASYLARGTKEYSVLIEPELLEQMAADEATKEKYLGILEDSTAKLDEMKNQLGDKADEVTHIGVAIGKEGEVSFFAELEKMSEKQRERIEKSREEKAEAAKLEEKKAEKKEEKAAQEPVKRARVQADSIEELIAQIQNMDWSKIPGEEPKESGTKIDFSV